MSRVKDGLISIPSGRLDLIPDDYEIIDNRVLAPVEFPEFKFTLRESQQAIYNQIRAGGIINADVSWGKTFSGIAIATKFGKKALIVVHNKSLLNMWVKEIEKTLGISPGIISAGKVDLDAPICVGNTQTLYRNIPKISKEFGTLIMDEMHHVPSATFSRIIDASYATHKLGLSGTIKRKDGKHVLFQDYFGSELYQPPSENKMKASVHIIKTRIALPDGHRMPWALKINELTRNHDYRELISTLATTYAAKGHKVLVVSDRVEFIRYCTRLIGEDICVDIHGQTDGAIRENMDEIMKEKQILFGSQSIFSEGVSVNALSCLILATPINNEPLLTQLIGRIVRLKEGKLSPVVVDINLLGNVAKAQAKNRLIHYIGQGYKVQYFQ